MEESSRKNILGSRIVQRRKQLGIKQSDLASEIGISKNQISNIENGKSFPKFGTFLLLCDKLGCNADYLIAGLSKRVISENITDMIASLTIDEQKTIWVLLDSYIHRDK